MDEIILFQAFCAVALGFVFLYLVLKALLDSVLGKSQNPEEKVKLAEPAFRKAFCLLPKESVKTLGKLMSRVTLLPAEQIPLEIYAMSFVLVEIGRQSNREIIQDSSKRRRMESAVSSYKDMIELLLGGSMDLVNSAADKGLDFGIITNSGADMALYAAMDYHEKKKNINHANMTIYNSIRSYTNNLKDELIKIQNE